MKASEYEPQRLIVITSSRVSDATKSSIEQKVPELPFRIIDRNEVIELVSANPSLQKGSVDNAAKRTRRQKKDFWMGIAGSLASMLGVIVASAAALFPGQQESLSQRIDSVDKAINSLNSLEKELAVIKTDLVETEKATEAIEAEYEQAKELQQLSDEQFVAVKTALQQQSWRKTAIDYLLGFVLGVGGSLTASVIYSRFKQRRSIAAAEN